MRTEEGTTLFFLVEILPTETRSRRGRGLPTERPYAGHGSPRVASGPAGASSGELAPGAGESGARLAASRRLVLTILWAVVLLGGLLVPGARAQTPTNGDLRLTAGSENAGVLEVYYDDPADDPDAGGEWGLVCDDFFEDVDATVACTQLGYVSGHVLDKIYDHNIPGQTRWLDDVACEGTETRLEDCPHRGWGVSDCGRFEYTAVFCSDVGGPGSIEYAENGTGAVATYTTEGSPMWSVEGTDADDFAISATGVLTFNASPDYETPTDADGDNVYAVTIQNGITDDIPLTVTITVTNVITSTGEISIEYAENGTGAVGTYTYDGTESPTWSVEGTDADDFSISSAGVLTFNAPPDYENPTDADGDNVYAVTVQNGITDDTPLTVTVTVTNVTLILGPSTVVYFENHTRRVGHYTHTAGGSPTWSVGGTDADDFAISATGDLTFNSPPDYENPTDADGDNVYAVTVQAGTSPDTWRAVTITVIDVGVQGPREVRHAENGTRVATYTLEDGGSPTWSVGGDDADHFSISTMGVLTFNTAPNYDAPAEDADGDWEYEVLVQAGDKQRAVTIILTNVHEPRIELWTVPHPLTGHIHYVENGSGYAAILYVADGPLDWEAVLGGPMPPSSEPTGASQGSTRFYSTSEPRRTMKPPSMPTGITSMSWKWGGVIRATALWPPPSP